MSGAWTGFTRFTFLNERPPEGKTSSGERLTRKQTTSRPDTLWPEIWKDMSDASKRKEKQKWAIEKPMLNNARRLRGICFIDPDDEAFKNIMKKKNARRKLEVLMPQQCLVKLHCAEAAGKPAAPLESTKHNTLVLLKPMNEETHGRSTSQIS